MGNFNFNVEDHGLQYIGAARIEGPLAVVERIRDVGYDEMVEIFDPNGQPRLGRVLDISETQAVVQVLEGTTGLSNQTLRAASLAKAFVCRFRGRCSAASSMVWAGPRTAVRRRSRRIAATSTACRSIPPRDAIRGKSSRRGCQRLTG